MNCEHVMEAEIAEKYLLGQLNEADTEAFEQHFFECPRCFAELQNLRALQAGLQQAEPTIQAEPAVQRVVWPRAWAAAAAVLLLAVGIGLWLRQTPPQVQPAPPAAVPGPQEGVKPVLEVAAPEPSPAPVPRLDELARVEPPLYVPVTLRGPADQAMERFREAMQHYVKADYTGAVPKLQAAAELNPQAPNIRFFLGVCYLLTEQTDPAIEELRRVAALGESPYLEEAHFYLAKAYLRKGDPGAAQEELKKTIQLHGELESEARTLIDQLQRLRKTTP